MGELYKPNELIGAIDQLEVSRTAKHLLNFFLQYAQKEVKFHAHSGSEFAVAVSQINGLADIHRQDYAILKKSLIKLIQPVVLRDDPKHFMALAPVTSIDIDVTKGLYKFELHPKVLQLLEQTDYFTKLKLEEFNPLNSKYAIIIYEWLQRYVTAPQLPQLSVADLRAMTNTCSRAYDNFTNIRDRVLDVAVKEISDKTPYTVSYETIKTRTKRRPKVTAIQFSFAKKTDKKSIAGFSGVVTDEIQQVHDKYLTLVNKYVTSKRATSDEVYRATYVADYGCLVWWYEHKTLPLSVLISDIRSGKRPGRWKSQLDKYLTLVSCLDLASQEAITNGKSKQGFCEQVLKMQIVLADTAPLDHDKWI